MNCVKFSFVLLILAVASKSGNSFFLHKKVVEIPVLKPVHLQPIIFQEPEIHEVHHHIENEVPTPAPIIVSTTESSHKKHLQQVWNSLKDSVTNNKIVNHFYHKNPQQEPHSELNVWPSLGFTQYKKIKYVPVFPAPAPSPVPAPVVLQGEEFFNNYIPHDQGHPIIVPDTFQFDQFPQQIHSLDHGSEISSVPKDVDFSVSGVQNKQVLPSSVSEQSNVKLVPQQPASVYGLPLQN